MRREPDVVALTCKERYPVTQMPRKLQAAMPYSLAVPTRSVHVHYRIQGEGRNK